MTIKIRFEGDENLLLASSIEQLADSSRADERWLGNFLDHYKWDAGMGLTIFGELALVQHLGVAVADRVFAASQQELIEATPNRYYRLGIPDRAFEWGVKFIKEILKEVRLLICNEKARKKAGFDLSDYKSYPRAMGISLASVITAKLGVTEPMAIGIATLVLLSIAQAVKNAFCTMTDDQVIEVIQSKEAQSHSRKRR